MLYSPCAPSERDRALLRPPRLLILFCLTMLWAITQLASAAEPFSIVLLPDPQYYSVYPSYDLYAKQARWIRDNKTTRNIKHAIFLGDLSNSNETSEWSVANGAFTILDNALVPYTVFPGNHDYSTQNTDKWVGACYRNLTNFNNNVGPQHFSGKSWYGGCFEAGHNENNYTFFSSGGLDFMVIGLEFSPRKEVLTWANNLISSHPNHRVIIATHCYLTTNGAYASGGGPSFGFVGSNGVDLFDECASRHSNVFLVVCGHVAESKLNVKTGVCGNTIYEMVVDYQGEKPLGNSSNTNLGNGWLRVLTFNPDTNTIQASTVTAASGSTSLFTGGVDQFYHDAYASSPTSSDHKFTMNYNMGPMDPYLYLNASTEFHDMAVNHIGGGDQLDPEIAQADNGNWASVWEDDEDGNGIFRVFVRGFDPDGNERFADTVVNTSGVNSTNAVNPSIAMASDGRFVVVWQSSTTAIKMRTYNANGTPTGTSEQTVVSTTGSVRNPDVAIDDNGNFVVVWEDDNDANGIYQAKARGFTFNCAERFAAKTVNTVASGQQMRPVIAMASNGDYVVAWEDDQNNDGSWDLGARGFYANETERFAQFCVNATTAGQQRDPDIAMDDSGRFVVVWEDDSDLNNSYQIKARGFSASGAEIFSERTVNQVTTGNQVNPAVAMDSLGNWYAVWEDDSVGEGYQMMSQEFTISGTRVFASDIQANSVNNVDHDSGNPRRQSPAISAHKSGRYIVAWADDMDGNGSFQILARGVSGTACSLVVKAPNGSVTNAPVETFYKQNSTVTLTATPNAGYAFTRWTGDVPAGSETVNPLTLTMDSDKNLTAEFASTVPPAAPGSLAATAVSSSQINLTWADNAGNEANYVVARATTAGGPYTDIATLAANTTAYSNTGLTANTTYYYVVRAINAYGASANSNEANATTLSPLPAAPGSLTATAVSSSQVNLAWADNASNEANYVVARAMTAGGPYTDIATLAANTTSYSNTGLTANTRYYYVVRATNANGASGNSNEANAITWPADIIVDNANTGFSASSNWATGTSAADKYGTNYRYRPTAAISDAAKWTINVPQSRSYDIYAWWSAGTNRSASAPFVMPDGTTVSKNQQTNGGKWNLLATKSLSAGNQTVQLSCWASTGYVVVADAVKLVAK